MPKLYNKTIFALKYNSIQKTNSLKHLYFDNVEGKILLKPDVLLDRNANVIIDFRQRKSIGDFFQDRDNYAKTYSIEDVISKDIFTVNIFNNKGKKELFLFYNSRLNKLPSEFSSVKKTYDSHEKFTDISLKGDFLYHAVKSDKDIAVLSWNYKTNEINTVCKISGDKLKYDKNKIIADFDISANKTILLSLTDDKFSISRIHIIKNENILFSFNAYYNRITLNDNYLAYNYQNKIFLKDIKTGQEYTKKVPCPWAYTIDSSLTFKDLYFLNDSDDLFFKVKLFAGTQAIYYNYLLNKSKDDKLNLYKIHGNKDVYPFLIKLTSK